MKYVTRRRLDGKYEIVIDGLVQYVHWDEERVRRWITIRHPMLKTKEWRDSLLYRACGKV